MLTGNKRNSKISWKKSYHQIIPWRGMACFLISPLVTLPGFHHMNLTSNWWVLSLWNLSSSFTNKYQIEEYGSKDQYEQLICKTEIKVFYEWQHRSCHIVVKRMGSEIMAYVWIVAPLVGYMTISNFFLVVEF